MVLLKEFQRVVNGHKTQDIKIIKIKGDKHDENYNDCFTCFGFDKLCSN